jgi:hypothetical protein
LPEPKKHAAPDATGTLPAVEQGAPGAVGVVEAPSDLEVATGGLAAPDEDEAQAGEPSAHGSPASSEPPATASHPAGQTTGASPASSASAPGSSPGQSGPPSAQGASSSPPPAGR